MSAAGYHVVEEPHASAKTFYRGKEVPPVLFNYAVRRADGSLVFRAKKLDQAEELVKRLEWFTR